MSRKHFVMLSIFLDNMLPSIWLAALNGKFFQPNPAIMQGLTR